MLNCVTLEKDSEFLWACFNPSKIETWYDQRSLRILPAISSLGLLHSLHSFPSAPGWLSSCHCSGRDTSFPQQGRPLTGVSRGPHTVQPFPRTVLETVRCWVFTGMLVYWMTDIWLSDSQGQASHHPSIPLSLAPCVMSGAQEQLRKCLLD